MHFDMLLQFAYLGPVRFSDLDQFTMKKICGLACATLCLLFVPREVPASPRPVDFSRSEGSAGFFASAQYKFAIPHFVDFVVENKGRALDTFAVKEKQSSATGREAADAGADATAAAATGGVDLGSVDSFEGKYSPEYLRSTRSGSVSAGYSAGSVRLEVEGIYQNFLVDARKYESAPDSAYNFAASSRDENSTTVATRPKAPYYVTMKNKEVTVSSLVANLCYDLLPESSQVSPSACIGAGGSLVEFLGVTEFRWAYQAKVGVQYFVSRKAALFSYAHAGRVHPKKFANIPVVHRQVKSAESTAQAGAPAAARAQGAPTTPAAPQAAAPAASKEWPDLLYPEASLGLNHFGVECGIRLIL
ncbi:P44/Msp2 family outer membrane protein [Anaplasma capra]|uniref:P44/Msp2 family outer membrane protein n=2 Tax=Anaplasma capra TaxID=1562740 RepID=UPI0021D5A497|nr:P44/Msp2 family outer membrane protein [Anaplasma capra]MCU7612730.1 P44/Msp2 family outer membrane protein [Anaplasma capra]